MPTNKKRILYQLDDEYYEKFVELKNLLKRKSESDLTIYIIESYIDKFEEENGKLK